MELKAEDMFSQKHKEAQSDLSEPTISTQWPWII